MLLERNCEDVDIVLATHMHADHTGWFIKYDSTDDESIVHKLTNARYFILMKLFISIYSRTENVFEQIYCCPNRI